MDKNVRKCVLIAGAFATISIGNVHPAWASETSMLEVAQQAKKQIKGRVVDATGETVIGANVLEKGTTNGVITDFDGNFVLNVSEGATLEISYIGYVTQTIKITNQTSLNIVLKEDSETLDEVVVVGYGTMKKSDLSGASVSVGEDAIKGSVITNLDQSLQGLVTGPNSMPAPAVEISFTTQGLDNTPVNTLTAEAQRVYDFLQETYEQKTISGMMANVAWNVEESEQVHQWTGKYPALNCFDYIHLQSSAEGSWIDYGDITPVSQWWNNGGLVAAMWHWNVPTSNGSGNLTTYKDQTSFDIDNAFTEGTWEYQTVNADLEKIAGYLKLLKDANIPVIWRPLHEAAGGWFWWGKNADSFKRL